MLVEASPLKFHVQQFYSNVDTLAAIVYSYIWY